MYDGVLAKIVAMVTSKTDEAMLSRYDMTKYPIEDVLDLYLSGLSIEEPRIATSRLCEELLFDISEQTDEQIKETIKLAAATLISCVVMYGVNEDDFFKEISECIREIYQVTKGITKAGKHSSGKMSGVVPTIDHIGACCKMQILGHNRKLTS